MQAKQQDPRKPSPFSVLFYVMVAGVTLFTVVYAHLPLWVDVLLSVISVPAAVKSGLALLALLGDDDDDGGAAAPVEEVPPPPANHMARGIGYEKGHAPA